MTTRETPPRACFCGDTVHLVDLIVPDHGTPRHAQVGWCADCQDVRGVILGEPILKLVEADLDRRGVHSSALNLYRELNAQHGDIIVPPDPPPHPLVRWWRRIVWGE